jgi:uncharacterized membrane protein YdjX (TVP38/TMEM64 family)
MEELRRARTGEDDASKRSSTKGLALRWLPLAIVVAGLLTGYALGLHHFFSLEALRRSQADLSAFVAAHEARAALAYLAIYIAAVALSFPGASFLTITGGFLFGAVIGTGLALMAATIGATIIFLVCRTSLGALLAEKAGPRMRRVQEGFRQNGFSYLLFLRLVPLFPFWLVNLAAALFGMRLVPYVLATAVGILPGTFVYAYVGRGLGTALGREGSLVSIELLVGLALLGVLALVPAVVRRLRRGKEGGGSRAERA